MIFFKKKKLTFVFPEKNGLTPDEKKYRYYKLQYGPPQLTSFGEHVWNQQPEKFVRDAKTGKVLIRTREVRYIGRSREGFNFYLGPKSTLLINDKAKPSFFE